MSSLDRTATTWMREHHATVPSETLEALGVSAHQRRRMVEAGVLERVVDGAYRFAGVEEGELARCAALCASRPHLVIAGPTAGRQWKIRRSPRDGLVHVLAPPFSQPCRESWVKPYRTALIDPADIVERADGVRITTPARTVVDLTRYLQRPALASAIESSLSERLCTIDELRRVAAALNTPGRPWARRFLSVLAGRHPGAARESDWEHRVFNALVQRGVSDLTSQVHQRLSAYGAARFDLAIPALQWVLEIDVHPEHRTLEGQASDHRRDRESRKLGWMIERVGEAELTAHFDGVMAQIVAAIDRRRAEVAALATAGLWPPRRTR